MKNIAILFNLIIFIAFFSCTGHKSKENKAHAQKSVGEDTFKLQKNFEYVHLIPDSLRTQEQQKLCDLILKTSVLHMKVENNHLIFDLSEVDFLKLGIPKPYYDLLTHDIKNINSFVDSAKIQRVDTILKDSYKGLYLRFKGKGNKDI